MTLIITRELLMKTYPWAADFSQAEQDQIIERLNLWGNKEADTNTFLDKMIHVMIEQDIQTGYYEMGLSEAVETAKRRGYVSLAELRSHFYKVILHVEN